MLAAPQVRLVELPFVVEFRIVRGRGSRLLEQGNNHFQHPHSIQDPNKIRGAPMASASVSSTSSSSSVESTTKGISSSRVRSAPKAREMRGSWRVAWILKPTSSCLSSVGG